MRIKYIGRGHSASKQVWHRVDQADATRVTLEGKNLEALSQADLATIIRGDLNYIGQLELEVLKLRKEASQRLSELRSVNRATQRKQETLKTLHEAFKRLGLR